MRFTLAELAEATGGRVTAEGGDHVEVDGATVDSRAVSGDNLFVPLVAERDGHDFVGAAMEAGAAAHLTSRTDTAEHGPAVVVADTAVALRDLGVAARRRLPDRVVGITGSVGKTSTKDLLAAALGRRYVTTANERSFNNELGVPLTLLAAPAGTEVVVVEMGARGRGHIRSLAEVARPTIGVVTSVAGAHLEMFGSIDEVATSKGELVEALPAEGVAVLNVDDRRVAVMAGRTVARVLTFGESGGDVRAEAVALDDELRPRFRLVTPGGSASVALAVHGRHNVANALAAAAAAVALGMNAEEVAAGLGDAQLQGQRMALHRAPSGAQVLDDTYNANPTSMRAALEALASLDARRRTAVLGTMAELGAHGPAAHREAAEQASELGIRVVALAEAAYGAPVATDVDAAITMVGSLDSDDAVLVKGSRVAGLERVVAELLAGSG